jgi:hypothetical protein
MNSFAISPSALHQPSSIHILPSDSRFLISTIRASSTSLKPRNAKTLALFHFLASFARKSNNTHTFRLPYLALFTKYKAFFTAFPTAPSKPRIPAGDPLIPLLPSSSLSPRAFRAAHAGHPSGWARAATRQKNGMRGRTVGSQRQDLFATGGGPYTWALRASHFTVIG